jgi:3-hydroxyisobutyrate dehydrogenase-like beta-hydroxyacid dehydrogenase
VHASGLPGREELSRRPSPGELGIYVGGDEKTVFEKIRPILECMGKNIIYMGGNGAGLTMKIHA